WYFPLIQRPSNNPNDPHKGQIALPGGRYELSDSSLQATALREAREEIGIVAQDVEVLGSLTPLYIPFSGYLVHPLVGKLSYSPEFILEVAEVARVIEVPLKELLDKGLRKQKDMPITNRGSLKSVNYFELQGNVVWGATAMMLSELVSIMEQHQIVQP
ncbi:MAG: CoA pyrophosphatase, partial [Bacteroidota bacterium]